MYVRITMGDKVISLTKNLRRLIAYAGKVGVEEIYIVRETNSPEECMKAEASVCVVFVNGAQAVCPFASFAVAREFFTKRLNSGRWTKNEKPVLRIRTKQREPIRQRRELRYYVEDIE